VQRLDVRVPLGHPVDLQHPVGHDWRLRLESDITMIVSIPATGSPSGRETSEEMAR
jgi:hypothetical protein